MKSKWIITEWIIQIQTLLVLVLFECITIFSKSIFLAECHFKEQNKKMIFWYFFLTFHDSIFLWTGIKYTTNPVLFLFKIFRPGIILTIVYYFPVETPQSTEASEGQNSKFPVMKDNVPLFIHSLSKARWVSN